MAIQMRAFHGLPEGLQPSATQHIVTTGDEFQTMFNRVAASPRIVLDFETSGLRWYKKARACGLGIGVWDESGNVISYYVPFRHQTGEQALDLANISPAIKHLWENPATLKIGHNLKFEDHFGRRENWNMQGPRYDTLVAARFYNENAPSALKTRAKTDLGIADAGAWEGALDRMVVELAKGLRMGKREYLDAYGYAQVNQATCGIYCCHDIEFTAKLYALYESKKLSAHYPHLWDTEMKLTEVLCDLEEHGLAVDVPYLQELQDQLAGVRAGLESQIEAMIPSGKMFNLASDAELRKYMQETLGCTLTKLTKSGMKEKREDERRAREEDEFLDPDATYALAVDAEVLEQFAPDHPVLAKILRWREAEKLANTYTGSILERVDDRGILHGSINQMDTTTGRMASRDPNLQNFPSDSDERAIEFSGKPLKKGGIDPWSIRRAFITRKEGSERWVRVFFDYSQIELRVLAHYSQDPVMVKAYIDGEDIHTRTSLEVFGTDAPERRRHAKVINFGLSYCMSAQGFARQAKIPLPEAEEFLAIFFERYKGITDFRKQFWKETRERGGWFKNMFGRARRTPWIMHGLPWQVRRAERQAIGSLIQGTAAELTKEALVRISEWLKANNMRSRLATVIHDDIQADVPVSELVAVARAMKQKMEYFPEFRPIPILVDGQYTTTNWAEKVSLPT